MFDLFRFNFILYVFGSLVILFSCIVRKGRKVASKRSPYFNSVIVVVLLTSLIHANLFTASLFDSYPTHFALMLILPAPSLIYPFS